MLKCDRCGVSSEDRVFVLRLCGLCDWLQQPITEQKKPKRLKDIIQFPCYVKFEISGGTLEGFALNHTFNGTQFSETLDDYNQYHLANDWWCMFDVLEYEPIEPYAPSTIANALSTNANVKAIQEWVNEPIKEYKQVTWPTYNTTQRACTCDFVTQILPYGCKCGGV